MEDTEIIEQTLNALRLTQLIRIKAQNLTVKDGTNTITMQGLTEPQFMLIFEKILEKTLNRIGHYRPLTNLKPSPPWARSRGLPSLETSASIRES